MTWAVEFSRNGSTTICIARSSWRKADAVYEYLFAKKDRGNIADDELVAFRTLAKAYAGLTDKQVEHLLQDKDLTEVCHDD